MHLRAFAIAAVALALVAAAADEPGSSRFGTVGDEAYRAIEREVAASDAAIVAAGKALSDSCLLADYRVLATVRDGEEIWTAALQKALDEHEIVRIPPRSEPYFIDAPVEIPSNRRILAAGATIALAKGATTLMLRTKSARDGTLAPVDRGCRSRNISIVGGIWRDNSVRRRGYGGSGRFYSDRREVGAFYGISTLFYLGNVDGVHLADVTFSRCGGFAVQCGDGDGFLFERVRFDDCFADGLHLNGNLTHVHARDIRGKVGDDLVALNAYDWLNSSVNFGPQRWILCEDLELVLKGGMGYPAIRIQPACYKYRDGTVVDCSISDVVFRRVRGITTFKMYLQTPRYRIGTSPEWSRVGTGGNIFFDDIAIDLREPIDNMGQYATSDPVRGHFGAFEFGANLSSVYFDNIDITFHCDKFPLSHLATVGPKSIFFPGKNGEPGMEIFDPYVSCTVDRVFMGRINCHGAAPRELVRATSFDNVDGDGRSSGRGTIRRLETIGGAYPDYGRVDVGDFAEVGPAEYRPFRRELRAFFPRECHDQPKDAAVVESYERSWRAAREWSAAHPGHTALELRRAVYAIERENFLPVLFDGSPFYCEAGINGGYFRGDGGGTPPPGRCTRRICDRFYRERDLVPEAAFRRKDARCRHRFAICCGAFVDEVHDLPPFHAVFSKGFGGIRRDVDSALAACPADDAKGRAELEAMADALDTIHALQLKFAAEAERRIAEGARSPGGLPSARLRNLRRIAEGAKRCPWEAPRTFYEGLNTLWFMREMMAYVDGLCCNALGRPDAWLIDLYRRDLAEGRLTEAEARDLVCRFMIIADCHLDGFAIIDGAADQEGEMPLTLGGCDAEGRPVWNELTRMFIEEHRRLGLVFPKLHVRFGQNSPREYLELVAAQVIGGHPVFAMFNDDVHIPSFIARGLPLERARDYEGTGCWDGFVDSATDGSVGNYTSAIHTLIAAVHGDFKAAEECGFVLEPLDGAKTFAEFRSIAYANYWRMLKGMLDDYTVHGRAYAEVSPCPLYSACLDGCVERRRDCRDGGMKWAPRCVNVGLLANVVDSLCAVDKVVYRDRFCPLGEFLAAVRANWEGERNQAIRNEVLKAPYWGDNRPESNFEMRFWIDSLSRDLATLVTDQGGKYEIACWIYREFLLWGEQSAASPDGRYRGDRFAQGFAPSEYRCKSGVSEVFGAIASLDHSKLFASNANLMFGGEDLTPELLAACFRVYARGKGHLLQPNSCDVDTLLDAQLHPERHLDLMVKVCGFSARFVSLSKRFQDEVIARHRLNGAALAAPR